MRFGIAMGLASLTLAGCTADRMPVGEAAAPVERSARAGIRTVAGLDVGQATATQSGDSIRIRVEAAGMPPGTYGAHIHMTGRCDAPAFASAGGHWNPTNRQHGKNNPAGMHVGDLPNLLVGTDGRGSLEINLPGASIAGGAASMLDADGASIVIHQSPDDYRTDPAGNSGARIACGVFG
jgi:Cu-Zn family superoxide dismutase